MTSNGEKQNIQYRVGAEYFDDIEHAIETYLYERHSTSGVTDIELVNNIMD